MSIPKPRSGPSRGLCVWLREHLRPSAASRVSHTRVKVLSGKTEETLFKPFSRGNILSTGKGFPGVKGGEVNDKTMNRELVEYCKHGAVKTSGAPESSGELSKKSRSFLPRFPCFRGKRRTGKVAPMPDPKVTPSSKNETDVNKSEKQNLILHDSEEGDYLCTKETELPSSGEVIGGHLSHEKKCLQSSQNMCKIPQGKYSDFKSEDEKLTGESRERKTPDGCLERQSYLRDTGSKARKTPNKRGTSRLLGHGDNTAPGFLLHTKLSRGDRHYTHEENQTNVESPYFDLTAPKRNSQSQMFDNLKNTKNESEEKTKLLDLAGDRNSSLEKSQNVKQSGTNTEIPEIAERSLTTKQLRYSKFNTKQDATKMAILKTCRGVLLNKAVGEKRRHDEECTLFDNTDCSEDQAAQGLSATGQDRQKLRVICPEPEKKEHVVDIWTNNFNESKELEDNSEGKGFQQSLMKSSSQPASYDIWRRTDDECKKTELPELVEGGNVELEQFPKENGVKRSVMMLSSKPTYDIWQRDDECERSLDGSYNSPLTSDYKDQEGAVSESINTSHNTKPKWFTEYNSKSGVSKSARPVTRQGHSATELTSVRSQAGKLGFLSQETCSGEMNFEHLLVGGKHFSLKDLGSYCCPERKQLHAGESNEEKVGNSDFDIN